MYTEQLLKGRAFLLKHFFFVTRVRRLKDSMLGDEKLAAWQNEFGKVSSMAE